MRRTYLRLLKEAQKVIKRTTTKNYSVKDYKNPPKKKIKKEKGGEPKYRTKVVIGKDGTRHLIRFAILKKSGPKGGHTAMTSHWTRKPGKPKK